MLILYCDASGSHYKTPADLVKSNEKKEPWYFLGALAVQESQRNNLFHLVQKLRKQYIEPLAPHGVLHEASLEV